MPLIYGTGKHRGRCDHELAGWGALDFGGGSGLVPDKVRCGSGHACATFTNGQIKCWGDNSHAQVCFKGNRWWAVCVVVLRCVHVCMC